MRRSVSPLWPGCPPGLRPRFAAQASGSPLRLRLLQPIARRRLAAVAAVEAKTALQLLDTLDETRDLLFQSRVLLPQPGILLAKPGVLFLQVSDLLRRGFGRCPRRRAVWRLGTAHVVVESFPEMPVKPPRQFRANRAPTHWPNMTNQTTWAVTIRPRGGAKDCHLGWWAELGVRLGFGDAVRGFFGGSGQRSHAELKRPAPASRPQGGTVCRVGVSLATRALEARRLPGPRGGIADSYRMSTTVFAVTDYSRCGRLLSPYPSMSTIITATTPSVSVRVTDRRRQRRASVRSPKEPLARAPLAFADPRCAWAHPVYVYLHDPGLVL